MSEKWFGVNPAFACVTGSQEPIWSQTLRPVRLSDAAGLHRHCTPDQPLDDIRAYLEWCLVQVSKGRMVRLVAELDGQIVASGQLTLARRTGEIGSLVVAPSCRQWGIGRVLLEALIEQARRRGVRVLEIAAHAEAAWVCAWYERQGFVPVGERVLPHDERVVLLRMGLPSG
jgi:GNAT superfamily N-acetyltransferase